MSYFAGSVFEVYPTDCHSQVRPDPKELYEQLQSIISAPGVVLLAELCAKTDQRGDPICGLQFFLPNTLSLDFHPAENNTWFFFELDNRSRAIYTIDKFQKLDFVLSSRISADKAKQIKSQKAVVTGKDLQQLLHKASELSRDMALWAASPDSMAKATGGVTPWSKPESSKPVWPFAPVKDATHKQIVEHCLQRFDNSSLAKTAVQNMDAEFDNFLQQFITECIVDDTTTLDESQVEKLDTGFGEFLQRFQDQCSLEGGMSLARDMDHIGF